MYALVPMKSTAYSLARSALVRLLRRDMNGWLRLE